MSKKNEILELLRDLNGDKLQNIVPEEHDILVVGKRKSDKDGDSKKINFDFTTSPSTAAIDAGVKKSKYLRVSFKRSGSITKSKHNDEEESFKGGKRAQAGNVFKNTQRDLYDFILNKLKANKYDIVSETDDGDPIVRLKATAFGARVSVTVPDYNPQTRDKDGNRKALTSPATYDPETDTFKKNQPVVLNVYRFFADVDDIEELEAVAARHYRKQVRPYEVGTVVVKTKKGGKKVKEKLEATLADPNESENSDK
jgi:hypothetical protein